MSGALHGEVRSDPGGRYRVPRFVVESILSSARFQAALGQLAEAQARPRMRMLREVRACLREMVSTPSPLFLDVRRWLDERVWLRGYELPVRHAPEEFERLRGSMQSHPTLLLFTHKAYGDAALPGLMCFLNDLPMLHTFGGINLDFPGFGALMRRSGGIFLRRSFRQDPVYRLALRSYLGHLLEHRFPMGWALEGTRSRLGKLMPPRYGLLKYTLDAARELGIENLHFVPFVTSFELNRDVEEYVAEQSGRVKKPESLAWLVGYARRARRPLGRLRVDLGEPVVVPTPPAEGDRVGLAKIAFEVAVEANRATPLTVTGVMCLVLLGMAPRGATAAELTRFVQVLGGWARRRGIRLSDELAADDPSEFLGRLNLLAQRGLLLRYDEGSEVVYAIDPARHPVAGYYRNTVAHHFVPKAFIELALLRAAEDADAGFGPAFWRETERLRELFKFEFFYPPREQFRRDLEAELECSDGQWRDHLGGDRHSARRLARRLQPFVGHAVLLPGVEAYAVVMDVLARLRPGQQLDEARCVAIALKEGRQAYLLRRISSEASIGRIPFANGFRLAAHLGLAGETTEDVTRRRRELLRELQALGRRMERLRLEVLARVDEVMAMPVSP